MITVHYAWRLGPKTTYGIQGYNTTATGYEGEIHPSCRYRTLVKSGLVLLVTATSTVLTGRVDRKTAATVDIPLYTYKDIGIVRE